MSLSQVTQSHLFDMGVFPKQTLTQQPFEAKMTTGSLTQIHHDALSKIEGHDYKELLSTLGFLHEQVRDSIFSSQRDIVLLCLILSRRLK